jgi:hypothetical protein
MNEKIEQMAKSIEDLVTMNAILQAWVLEIRRAVTDPEVQEVHNSHIGERREDERSGGSRVEESGERNNQEEEFSCSFPLLKPRSKGWCKA